jgi:hypothetical protein
MTAANHCQVKQKKKFVTLQFRPDPSFGLSNLSYRMMLYARDEPKITALTMWGVTQTKKAIVTDDTWAQLGTLKRATVFHA